MSGEENDRGGERSGRYPGVALADALAAAEKLYKQERQAPVDNVTAAAKMGYKGLSGPARVMIGSLRQYGLIEKTTVGRFRLSKMAIEAMHGNEAQKASALKTAALNPPLFAELAKTHLEGSEDNLRAYLITEKGFIDTGARNAAKAFRDTMALAKITNAGYNSEKSGNIDKDKQPRSVTVGDYVQWESQGVEQFAAPPRVLSISDDGQWVFVEGTQTGLPMEQLQKVDPPAMQAPPPPSKPVIGVAREVSSLTEGEAMLQWPSTLSKDSVAELEAWLNLVIKKLKRRYTD